jgi:surfactin family lipopeptide synthetase C
MLIDNTTNMMSLPALVKEKIELVYPLSPLQKGMIFHSLLAPKSGAYVLQDVIDFDCDINQYAFWEAWQQLIERHSIFRSLFMRMETELPLQVTLKNVHIPRQFIDMSNKSAEEQEKALKDLQYEDWIKGFDFQKPPLMRVILIKKGDSAYRMIWSQHHALTDGWSGPIVWKDWLSLYHINFRNEPVNLHKAPAFQTYIRWLNAQDHSEGRAFWQRYLQGYVTKTTLPLSSDKSLVAQKSTDKGQANIVVPPKLAERLEEFVKFQGITLNIAMQGAWAYLLHLYGGQDDILFGATVSGRPSEIDGVGKIVGPFINTVPVRALFNKDSEILMFLKGLFNDQISRTRYEYMSLIDVHEFTQIPRGENLFETLFVFDNYPSSGENSNENLLTYSQVGGFSYNHYPLTVMVVPRDKLYVSIKYDSRLYKEETVLRLMKHFCNIIEVMIDSVAGQKFSAVCFLPSEEAKQIAKWNYAQATQESIIEEESPTPFIREFEKHALQTPESIALVSEQASYSYQELNCKANQLANYLAQLGVKKGDFVGITVERSDYIVLSMLAAHKLGAAYVVIDGEWPLPRMSQVIENSGVTAVVTEQVLLNKVADTDTDAMLVSLDRDWDDIETCEDENPGIDIALTDIAYSIYTSGSTGVPKGVVMGHRALYFYIKGMLPQVGVSNESEWLALSTPAADLGYTALFGALFSGGTLRQLPSACQLDAVKMTSALEERPVDVLKIVPSHLAALMTVEDPARLLPKKCLITGGDVLPPRLLDKIWEVSPGLRVVNHYGPSETCVGALTCIVDQEEANRATIAIGRPMAHREVYILDKNQRATSIGVVGEIYLGGEGIAEGYHNQPELTAEYFVTSPRDNNKRLYRTGDLGRFREDGRVEFLGRADYQIKLRGHRIELGEIEKVLVQNRDISQAVVLVKNEQLVAFVVTELNEKTLIEYSQSHLSEVMQPSHWVPLKQLPLNANGKVNRKELEVIDVNGGASSAEYVPPSNEIEKQLSLIWLELLKRVQIGVHDNFFQSGGNSLLLIRLHSWMIQKLNANIELVDLFTYPTIAMQAEFLSGHQHKMELSQLSNRVDKRKAVKGKFKKKAKVENL